MPRQHSASQARLQQGPAKHPTKPAKLLPLYRSVQCTRHTSPHYFPTESGKAYWETNFEAAQAQAVQCA